ncbi:DRMBL-domain-containing protein [Dendrothele bispora CBS 962.96]|uniref:DRMBL-domain-containing protein n=1 Tax=Dendrothele bispora (strain CBS 962.96) TaxID=1314807 RepID=A0A4S8LUN4_DENBC|nr:DRMBL-domain-containing protein [Dendrothele bispora CBS 962.96]
MLIDEVEFADDASTTPKAEHTTVNGNSSTPKLLPLSSLSRHPSVGPSEQKKNKPPDTTANLFSVLMSSRKENEAWKEADVVEDRSFRPTKANGGRRKAPFYKVLQGMPIAVDAFKYGAIPGVKAYFLTHAHSDHYTNLSSNWKNGPIYCSEGTANLIVHMLKVDRKWVHSLPMDTPTLIPDTGDVRVTLIEANHCPGSTLFLFEGKQTTNAGDSTFKSPFVGSSQMFRYLHCGDFRASPQHVLHPAVRGKKIDHVYLDTTYLDPRYTFPPQPLVISACADLAKRIASGSSLDEKKPNSMTSWITTSRESKEKEKAKPGRILMVVGTYSIGKERIVKAIAKALHTKVYCDARKAAILRCQSDPELHAMLTKDPLDANVHLVPLGVVTSDKLKPYVDRFNGHFSRAIGFRPTGWTYTPPAGSDSNPSIASVLARVPKNIFSYTDLRPARNSTPQLQMYPVPYSEHSSFLELTCFAMSFQWTKMIATVNVGSESSRGKMSKWVKRWEAERKKKSRDFVVPHRQVDYW